MSTSFKLVVLLVFLAGTVRSASAEINVKQVRKQYQIAGVDERLAIIKRMALTAKDVEPAVRVLEEGVNDRDERIRFEAISALRMIGPSAGHVVPYVITVLKDQTQSSRLRLLCIQYLSEMGSRASGAEIELARILNSERDISLRRAAATALSSIGGVPKYAVPPLIEALKSDDQSTNPSDPPLSHRAASSLGRYGRGARAVVPVLMEMIGTSKDRTLRIYCLNSLGEIGTNPDKVVPFLIRLLDDKVEEGIRNVVARAIMKMGPDAKAAIPHLLKALDVSMVPDLRLRDLIQDSIIQALGAMGPDGKEAVPALLSLFRDTDTPFSLRMRSLHALGDIGSGAAAAVPKLIASLIDPQFARYHQTIMAALATMGSPVVKPLMAQFEMAAPYARVRLIRALAEIGPPAKDAIPLLEQQTRDEDQMVRDEAAKAIRRIRPKRP